MPRTALFLSSLFSDHAAGARARLDAPGVRVALIYALFSAVWIIFSDQLLALLISDAATMATLQTVKGLAFVTITAALIYFLLRREFHAVQTANSMLRESEESFRTISENIAAAIYILHGGKIVYANATGISYTGYSLAELLTKHVWELVHPDFQALVKERAIARLSGPLGPARYEIEMITKAGHGRWLEVTAENIRHEGKDLSLATAYDISALKRQERKSAVQATTELAARQIAETAEQRIRDILEGVSDGFIEIDTDWCFTYLNTQAAKMLGRDARDLIGKNVWAEFLEVEDGPFYQHYKKAMATQSPIRFEEKHGPSNRWFEKRLVPSSQGLSVFFHDITERKHSEDALRRNAQHLDNVLDSLHAFVGVLSPSGIMLEANRAALRAGGISADDVLGKPFWETYWWAYSEKTKAEIRAACERAAQGKFCRFDVRVQGVGGRFAELDLAVAPLYDDAGNITHLIPSAVAITERVRAESQVRALNAELEQRVTERTTELVEAIKRLRASERSVRDLNTKLQHRAEELQASAQEVEAFSYSVSHDLRAPLRAVQGFSQALLEDYGPKLDSTGQDFAQRLVASAARMDTLIQDLLDYSRLSRAEFHLQYLGLSDLVAESINHLQSEIQKSGAVVSVAEPLPHVWAHKTTLVQVITNLLANGIKFVAPGVVPEIRVWAESQTGRIRLNIEDNGIGVPGEHAERIFRVFERLHGIETYPGTGIGLAIVKKVMERMGGKTGVDCELGKGARFWIEWSE